MAEQFQRSKLYEYGANSNLVLEADRSEGAARRRDEDGKGEVESLHGRLNTIKMGEFVNRDRQSQLNEKLEKIKLKRERMELDEANLMNKKKKDIGGSGGNIHLGSTSSGGKNNLFLTSKSVGLLSVTEDLESINYRPKTRESRQAYEEILSMVQISLGIGKK
jgi:pre-mRNA-splicing helicase BRR2